MPILAGEQGLFRNWHSINFLAGDGQLGNGFERNPRAAQTLVRLIDWDRIKD
jgi:hypothetical protein